MVAYRARILNFPSVDKVEDVNGYLTVKDGIIKGVSIEKPANEDIVDFSEFVVLPGFVDTHIHLPQLDVRGKWSGDLLSWLNDYIFPEEMKFLDPDYTVKRARAFFELLAKNGTTTALVYGPPSAESTDAAMDVAKEYGLRVYMGQTLMDTNVPEDLKTKLAEAKKALKEGVEKWGCGMVQYAITLRFAISCSMDLMRIAANIARNANAIIQTHISEQKSEIETVKRMYGMKYAFVYEHAGVLYPRTVLAHGIHLDDEELALLKSRGAKISHCPSSNFFLHSGVMNMDAMDHHGIDVALGSDIAAGPFINMLPVLRDAYYANFISPTRAFYHLTLGGAKVLGIENITGTLTPGKSADFTVLKVEDMENMSAEEILSNLMFLGDDRNVVATYVRGKEVWTR